MRFGGEGLFSRGPIFEGHISRILWYFSSYVRIYNNGHQCQKRTDSKIRLTSNKLLHAMIYNFQLHDLVNDIGLSALNNQSRPELH